MKTKEQKKYFAMGVQFASEVAATYNSCTRHPYRLDDCILAKLNLTNKKPRKNKLFKEYSPRVGDKVKAEIIDTRRDLLNPSVKTVSGIFKGYSMDGLAIISDKNLIQFRTLPTALRKIF